MGCAGSTESGVGIPSTSIAKATKASGSTSTVESLDGTDHVAVATDRPDDDSAAHTTDTTGIRSEPRAVEPSLLLTPDARRSAGSPNNVNIMLRPAVPDSHSHSLSTDAGAVIMTGMFASVAETAAPARVRDRGLACSRDVSKQRAFIAQHWLPFVSTLQLELEAVKLRAKYQFSKEERMPSQLRVLELTEHCLELTERWYGKNNANLSLVYEFLVEASNYSGETFYDWRSVRYLWSADGCCRVVDGQMRERMSKLAQSISRDADAESPLPQSAGESPIDNSVLPNVLSPIQARILLTGTPVSLSLVAVLPVCSRLRLLFKII